ncbi:MAG: hypothetical protein EA391_10750 [Balneolaceae bacterium]|nr:MAG: hypothetical protein EA391_10750 [Balneolaceae bacterium]
MGKILFTAHPDTVPEIITSGTTTGTALLHLPLETYYYSIDEEMHAKVERKLDLYAYVIYGSRLHAHYFLRWAKEYGQLERIQNLVNLVMDQPAATYLEQFHIPAVKPKDNARSIDLIEFLLRISHEGAVLYPTGDHKTDEIPGLLIELEMPFTEFQVFSEDSLDRETLEDYRNQVRNSGLKAILFHNESSILRVQTAFPHLNLATLKLIAAGGRVSRKLQKAGFKDVIDLNGDWNKLPEVVDNLINQGLR